MKSIKTHLYTIFYGILIVLSFTCCGESYPNAIVIEGEEFIIYKASPEPSERTTFKYAVTDNSKQGWTFKSDRLFSLGDTLVITKK